MKFEIRHRATGEVLFTADIDADDETPTAFKMGMAVRDACLLGADLSEADLRGFDLRGADLNWANLRRADLSWAYLSADDMSGVAVPNLDGKILAAIDAGGALDMDRWHTCRTTHCRAGWAITLAGAAGAELEAKFGHSVAGAMIYAKSYPDLPIPNFYVGNDEALADMRSRAAATPETGK